MLFSPDDDASSLDLHSEAILLILTVSIFLLLRLTIPIIAVASPKTPQAVMGGDGGTISSKRKFLRTTALGKRKAQDGEGISDKRSSADVTHRLSTCAISNQRLKEPIVGCRLGNLYSKEEVIKYLLMDKSSRKKKHGNAFRHVRKLKDVVELTFQMKKVHGDLKDGGANPPHCWVCPVTNTEMNAKTPFCFLWDTGNVYSVKATKELPSACDNGNILNLIRLAPSGTELDSMREKLKAEKHLAKKMKK